MLIFAQHRANDFSLILGGVIGILQEQMSSVHPLLPGSKRPVPYIVETSTRTLYVSVMPLLTVVDSHILLEDD